MSESNQATPEDLRFQRWFNEHGTGMYIHSARAAWLACAKEKASVVARMADEYTQWIDFYHQGGDFTDFMRKRYDQMDAEGRPACCDRGKGVDCCTPRGRCAFDQAR